MKLGFLCDIHLPAHRQAPQYAALHHALQALRQSGIDLLVIPGDFTAAGDQDAAAFFLQTLQSTGLPFVLQIGNSDLRAPETQTNLLAYAAPTLHRCGSITLLALHDADRRLSAEDFAALHAISGDGSGVILSLHHPIRTLEPEYASRLLDWLEIHPRAHAFFAHCHFAREEGRLHWLPALDPDKAIGGSAFALWDTETESIQVITHPCQPPPDLLPLLGFSAYNPLSDLAWAAEQHISCIELRPNALLCDQAALTEAVAHWRTAGGSNLSLHAPDVCWSDGPGDETVWQKAIDLALSLHADRLTVHVPQVSVQDAARPQILAALAAFLARHLRRLPAGCAIGIENMHMTAKDRPDDSRRYGYLPQECLAYADLVEQHLGRTVGINLDIGHARNNAPFSQRYPVGSWYAAVGSRTVGYHLHQVTDTPQGFVNHTPFTGFTQPLISLESFFFMWRTGSLNHVPVILEICPDELDPAPYRQTLRLFRDAVGKDSQ